MNKPLTNRQPQDSATLYEAWSSHDTAVQTEAIQTMWQYLYRIAYNISYNQADASALAQDCAQKALIRIHQQLANCQEPQAFRSWCRRIVSNLVIDELRQRKRLIRPDEERPFTDDISFAAGSAETAVVTELTAVSLRQTLQQSPMSERSQRVVIGRYLDELPDEQLAQVESDLAGSPVAPSHIQVTRAKNIAKLRRWDYFRTLFEDV
jgi:RNA polymerase sigma-70 factor (ECF subfamily)